MKKSPKKTPAWSSLREPDLNAQMHLWRSRATKAEAVLNVLAPQLQSVPLREWEDVLDRAEQEAVRLQNSIRETRTLLRTLLTASSGCK